MIIAGGAARVRSLRSNDVPPFPTVPKLPCSRAGIPPACAARLYRAGAQGDEFVH